MLSKSARVLLPTLPTLPTSSEDKPRHLALPALPKLPTSEKAVFCSRVRQTRSQIAANPRPPSATSVYFSVEIILTFELTGDFELGSEPIVFVSMSSIRNWYQI